MNDCLVSVDGTDFRVPQYMPFSKIWYSHKFKAPGVRYEVGLTIRTGHIVWIHGPFPCESWPDMKNFRHVMIHFLGPGERVEADLGYRGCVEKVRTPHCPDILADKEKKKIQ